MKVLYFAWLRTRVGHAEDQVVLPKDVKDVRGLIDHLRKQGPNYETALKDLNTVRVAVNHDYVKLDHPLKPTDEVALFPPVTGG